MDRPCAKSVRIAWIAWLWIFMAAPGYAIPIKIPIASVHERSFEQQIASTQQLFTLMDSLSTRWEALRNPVIAPSGRTWIQIYSDYSEKSLVELPKAMELAKTLIATPLANREAMIQKRIRRGQLTELDLWAPLFLAYEPGQTRLDRIRALEAFLEWSTALNRRDALLEGVAAGLNLGIPVMTLERLLGTSHRWCILAETEPPSLGKAQLFAVRGELLARRGTRQEALAALRSARAIFNNFQDSAGIAKTLVLEGHTLIDDGALDSALKVLAEAYDYAVKSGRRLLVGNSLREKATALRLMGEDQRALEAFQAAREEFNNLGIDGSFGKGNVAIGMATILLKARQYERALSALDEAEAAFKGDANGAGNVQKARGDVFLAQKKYDKAIAAYDAALGLFGQSSPHGQGVTYLGKARSESERKNWPASAHAASEASRLLGLTDHKPDEIQALLLEARAEMEMGHEKKALMGAERAIALHGPERQKAITDQLRTVVDESISRAYDVIVPALARQPDRSSETLTRAEEARSRVLLDLLASGAELTSELDADLSLEQTALRAELAEIEVRLSRTADPAERQHLFRMRARATEKLRWNSYERIAKSNSHFGVTAPLTADAIVQLSQEIRQPLLLYYTAPSEVLGFLVKPNSSEILVRSIAISRNELLRRARDFAHDLANDLYKERAPRQARDLWEILVAPFAEDLPESGPLTLIPHGPLHELPFEALLDTKNQPLFERWQTSIAPSASALSYARRPREATDSFVAFSSGRGLNLPPQEIAEIAGFFGPQAVTFKRTEASFESYSGAVAQARNIVLDTHGVYVQGSRTATYLEIEPTANVHDGRLTAAEIASIPLKAELVTLAACDTSYGAALLSDERLDLTRSFLIAGAASVLATRWKVPEDTATSRFLEDFYRAYRRGGPSGTGMRKDQALADARRRSLRRNDPAQVWAAWVLVGDSE